MNSKNILITMLISCHSLFGAGKTPYSHGYTGNSNFSELRAIMLNGTKNPQQAPQPTGHTASNKSTSPAISKNTPVTASNIARSPQNINIAQQQSTFQSSATASKTRGNGATVPRPKGVSRNNPSHNSSRKPAASPSATPKTAQPTLTTYGENVSYPTGHSENPVPGQRHRPAPQPNPNLNLNFMLEQAQNALSKAAMPSFDLEPGSNFARFKSDEFPTS